MADTREYFFELIKEEDFLKALLSAKTPEDGCAMLLEKGLKIEPENFTKLMNCIEDALSDEAVEAVAGGLGNITNENVNIGGAQLNRSYNDTWYKEIDNSFNAWGTLEIVNGNIKDMK